MTNNSETLTTIPMPAAPDIPGLCLRAYRDTSDCELVHAIIQQHNDCDGVDWFITVEDVVRFFEHPHNFDPHQDALFVQVGSQPVGYVEVGWRRESEGRLIYHHEGFLIPAWRRKGIGSAMLKMAETRLRVIAAEHNSDEPKVFRAWAEETEIGKIALLESAGYKPTRYFFEMVCKNMDELPSAPMPPGLEIRPVTPEHYRPVWDALAEAFRDHWSYTPPAEAHYQRWLKSRRFQPQLWVIAWDGDQVTGTILNYIDAEQNKARQRKRGYTEDICVRRPWRRRGLARAMLVRSIQRLRDEGMTEAALGVDTENPSGALGLYENVGFKPYRNANVYEKPMT
jgi:GNAT superfamily N-acetyltransferase